jgi:FkbM family methyltransferase
VILEAKILARFALRRMKLTSLAHRFRMLWHKSDYEDRFADVLLASVKPDDCVWDVGANVGYYTERLSKLARHVVAFEPVNESCQQITSKALKNVECLPIALGDTACEMPMFINRQFSSLAMTSPGARPQTVRVARGDDLTSLPRPTVIKVDVEGYELEVIRGMHEVLNHVRALFLEIHFQILEDRGMRLAPATLIKELKQLGFSKITWPDASHVAAFRV